MRTIIGLRAVLCVVVAMLAQHAARAIAEDAAPAAAADEIAKPSVEEPATRDEGKGRARARGRRAGDRHPRGDLPDDRIGCEGQRSAAGVFRPRDLAGEPLSVRCRRTGDAQRPARAGHRAIHAGNGQRAPAARSLRSRTGAAQVRGIPERVAKPVRQSRPCGGGLQCRTAAGAGMAGRLRPYAAGDAQLRLRHHRHDGR